MAPAWVAFAAALGANALVTAFLAQRVLRQRHVPGNVAFAAAMAALSIWAGGYAGETAAAGVPAKRAWLYFENLGIVSLVPLFFLFALRYTGASAAAARRAAWLVALVPLVTLVLLFAGRHYAAVRPYSEAGGPLVVTGAPWYYVHTGYSHLLMLAGTALIVRAALARPERFRASAAVLLSGIAFPWLANVYYIGRPLWPELAFPVDLTPLAFGALGIVYGVGVFGLRLFDLVPVARDAVLERLPEMVLVLDAEDRLVDANRAAVASLGGERAALLGRRIGELESAWAGLAALPHEDGEAVPTLPLPGLGRFEVAASPLRDRLGRRAGRVLVVRDVTEREQADERIRLLSAAIGSATTAVAITDPKGVCLWVNPAFTQITGYASHEIIGKPVSLLKSGAHDAAFYGELWSTITRGEAWRGEMVNRRRDGSLYTEEQTISPVRDDQGRISHFIAVKQDVSERRRMEEGLRTANALLKAQLEEIETLQRKLEEQATRDPLTGAFNRRYLAETMVRETARARRDGRAYAVVILDLDLFKRVNDSYGHDAGDRVLVRTAELLRAHTRESDLVCRYGGEEFVVLMPGSSAVSAARRAELWRASLEQERFTFKGGEVGVTLSAGVACFPDDGADGEGVLRAADDALYSAKNAGRNRIATASGPNN